MEFTILHQATYRYPEKIRESYSIVHLQPRSDASQYCTKYELNVAPRTRVFSYVDRFGNDVQHFAVLADHDVLSVTARSSIVTVRSATPARPSPVTLAMVRADEQLRWMFDEQIESRYVVLGPGLRAFATEVGEPGRDYRYVSPVRGVYKGASRSTMSVNVAMEALAAAQQ